MHEQDIIEKTRKEAEEKAEQTRRDVGDKKHVVISNEW